MNVELIDYMGSDLSVCNAARVSFAKASDWEEVEDDPEDPEPQMVKRLSERDAKLIRYLAKHNHWTPFAHCFVTLRIKAPIFVTRQLHKHQTGLVVNEVSRRYVDSEPDFYDPTEWRKRADNVKQGSSDEPIDLSQIDAWSGDHIRVIMDKYHPDVDYKDGRYSPEYPLDCRINEFLEDSFQIYKMMIKVGVCPEQARMILPQSTYTEFWWSGSLAAFARVCKLRLDPHTQKETRDVAEMIDALIRPLFPVSWDALMEN